MKFSLMLCIVFSIFTSMLWYGNSAERRYKNSACQYRMIYNYSPKPEMGLVTLGGSRLRVSTSARHFNQILNKLRPNYSPMHNLSHSIFTRKGVCHSPRYACRKKSEDALDHD
jgi:hypothetical protein